MTVRPLATALVASAIAVLALAACGSGDGGGDGGQRATGDGSPAVTAAGADGAIADEGDGQPLDDGETPVLVAVTVDVPQGVDLAGTAIVALEDVTFSDTEASEIARIELPVADLRNQADRVELLLPLPLDGSFDVTATVHIDVDQNGTFSQGDWISPDLAPVTSESVATGLTVAIVQI